MRAIINTTLHSVIAIGGRAGFHSTEFYITLNGCAVVTVAFRAASNRALIQLYSINPFAMPHLPLRAGGRRRRKRVASPSAHNCHPRSLNSLTPSYPLPSPTPSLLPIVLLLIKSRSHALSQYSCRTTHATQANTHACP